MIAVLGSLLEDIIDYAGLFPPARLEMDQAIETFAVDREGSYQNMLRHFILPAKRISEFERIGSTVSADSAWPLSVLIGGGESLRDWTDNLESDLAAATSGIQTPGNPNIRVLEIALPTAIAADTASFAQAIDDVLVRIVDTHFSDCDLFFETTSSEHRRILAGVLSQQQGKSFRVGLKLRTGGIESQYFPSVEELADVIQLCASNQIPWKATAGLHHPLPHDCPQVGATMHGFLNLLVGVVLFETNQLKADRLRELLADREPSHFVFSENELEWNRFFADRSQVIAGRERFVSFGSCSFTEPIEDLLQLGLLPEQPSLPDS